MLSEGEKIDEAEYKINIQMDEMTDDIVVLRTVVRFLIEALRSLKPVIKSNPVKGSIDRLIKEVEELI